MKYFIATAALKAFLTLVTAPGLAADAHDHASAKVDGPQAAAGGVKTALVYQHEVPNIPGKSVKGVLVEYAPGAKNPPHTHAASALIYATVLEGTVLNQLNNGPLRTFRKGENFTELPGDLHNVSANGSQTEPAKLLAVFIVDTNDLVLTKPVTQP